MILSLLHETPTLTLWSTASKGRYSPKSHIQPLEFPSASSWFLIMSLIQTAAAHRKMVQGFKQPIMKRRGIGSFKNKAIDDNNMLIQT